MTDEQYFAHTPRVAPGARRTVTLRADDRVLELQTDRGVFSRNDLDTGTRVLLAAIPRPPTSGNLLDLGCGWGPIAATMAAHSPDATVWAIDINKRALDLTRSNAQDNRLLNIRACAPEEVPADIRFDTIWSNPPVRIGKSQLHDLLEVWLSRLSPVGEAWLVINRNLGADSLAVWLENHGYRVDRLTSKQGFRVLRVRPATPEADQH